MATTPPAESFTETSNAFAEDREQRFIELASEIPDDDAPETQAAAVERSSVARDLDSDDDPAASPAPASTATQATPAAAQETPADSDDPLTGAVPFTYTVNGQAKPYDGIQEIPGHGAIVSKEALTGLRDTIQRSEHATEANKQLYQTVQQYESFEFKGQKGAQGIDSLVAEHAVMEAAIRHLAGVIENPDALAEILGDPNALVRMQRELSLIARETKLATRGTFTARSQETRSKEQEATQLEQADHQTISAVIDKWGATFPSLTAQDKQEALAYLAQFRSSFVRPATPDEARQAGVKPGERIIDEKPVHDYLERIAKHRADAASLAASTAKSASENAKRLGAAAVPRKGPKPATPAPPAKAERVKSNSELWQDQKNGMAAGRFSTVTDDS